MSEPTFADEGDLCTSTSFASKVLLITAQSHLDKVKEMIQAGESVPISIKAQRSAEKIVKTRHACSS